MAKKPDQGPLPKTVKEIEQTVDRLLAKGSSKDEIRAHFAGDSEAERWQADHFLAATVALADRRRVMYPNFAAAIVLAYLTLKGLVVAFSAIDVGFWMATYLVPPMIHLYVLRQVLRFRKVGYQLLMVVALLALVNPENRALPELVLFPALAALGGFLYWKLFSKAAAPVPPTP